MGLYTGYAVIFNGVSSTDAGAYATKRPMVPPARWKATREAIPGMDGDKYILDGTLEDKVISVTFNFLAARADASLALPEADAFSEVYRRIIGWLDFRTPAGGDIVRLSFKDDPAVFYGVKYVRVITPERTAKRLGQMTVEFVCEGWTYRTDGLDAIRLTGQTVTINNPTIHVARPVFRLSNPSANITLAVEPADKPSGWAQKTFAVLSGANSITLDSRRMVAVDSTGAVAWARTNGGLACLALYPGRNTLTITGGYTSLTMVPLWREST